MARIEKKINAYGVLVERSEGRGGLEDPGVDGRIMLK
jgi:hypothetical protein